MLICSAQNAGVDYQHAVIEYSEADQCYVIQDLNTAQGTFVNGCRVQNAAVRLAPGDSIQFGYDSSPYILETEGPPQVQIIFCFLDRFSYS